MSESSDNKPDESFLSEVSIEDGENTEPVDWKLNNTNLAKENALLRKEIQRYANIFKENSIRCNNLEVAWRRRGETLAKVDIISRLAGTQILKLLDSLTELRTACQVDLQTPLEGATGQVSHLRHSLPSKSDKLGIPTNVKPQLVNHVNPMVSGHPIIKPTITLRRLNINTSTRPQEEEILEPVEEVVLSGSENQSSESEDEEDDIVIPPNFRRLASPTLSSNGTPYYSFDLPVAEVPLVRLSMSNISERTKTGVQDQNRNICNDRSEMHSEIDFVHSDNEVIEIDSTPANISSTSDSSLPTTVNSASTSDSLLPTTANSASTSGSSLPASSMRKYPGSSSKLSEDRKSDILAGVEKCRLVVSLRDVGSYLHNGILSSIEQLEEGKVKTGASAQPESKDSPSCINDELQLNETATAVQDQTELNFSAIGNLNYSAVPIRNDNVEGSSSSSSKEFLSKLQKEDPLEGPSWRYSGLKTSSKRKGRCTQNTSSPPKKRNQSANRSSRQKKQIPASLKSSSKLSKGNHDEAQCEDDDGTNLTNCVALPVKTDVSPTDCKYEEQTNYSASSNEGPPVLEVQENFSITKNNKKRKGKSSGVKVKVERCNPNRKPPSLKKETNAATPQANRKPPYLKNETIEVAPVFDSKIKDKTESSTSSDEFLGFPTSNVSDENANMTRKRRKLLSLGSDADEEENEDEDYIPPSQRSKNSKRGTTSRKPKGKSVNSLISKKKKKADNTNVVQGKSGSLPAATEVQTDVETKKKNPPKKVAKRRSRSLQRKSGNLQAATEVHTDVGTKTKKPRKNVTKRRSRLTPTFERKHESPQAGAEVHSDEETYTKKSPKTVTKRRSSSVPTLERNQESLLVAAELQTDVETRTKNSPNNVTTRRSSSRTAAKKLRQSQRI